MGSRLASATYRLQIQRFFAMLLKWLPGDEMSGTVVSVGSPFWALVIGSHIPIHHDPRRISISEGSQGRHETVVETTDLQGSASQPGGVLTPS